LFRGRQIEAVGTQDGKALDMTCCSPASFPTAAAATTTGQARDDDAEERGNSCDDGLKNGGNAVNDCHDTSADGLAERTEA